MEEQIEKFKDELSIFIVHMKKVNGYEKIIEDIFSLYFQHNVKYNIIGDLKDHIYTVFKVNPNHLLHYMADTNLYIEPMNAKFSFINNLKARYGMFVARLLNSNDNPFLITGAEVNVQNGGSVHKLSFTRNDQKKLDGQFTPATMLTIISLLTNATTHAVETGIYNLNEQELQNYYDASDNFISLLKSIQENKKV